MDELWKENPIIKRDDGTYVVIHNNIPYHVCTNEIDPSGIYDLKEVEEYYNNLPTGDPKKLTQKDEIQKAEDDKEIDELNILFSIPLEDD